MFRAMRLIAAALALAAVVTVSNAQIGTDPDRIQNLIAMVDYLHPPDFKAGTWIRYSVETGSVSGQSQKLATTLLVPGEERFWGEDGFWLETQTELRPGVGGAVATLMSYSAFEDSFPIQRMQHYMRKTATPEGEGKVTEEIVRRSITAARVRKWLSSSEDWKTDTLGPDTLHTPWGVLDVIKVRIQRGTGATQDTRDSTVYMESRETRIEYRSMKVPITHIAREDVEWAAKRRAWRIGQSQEGAPFQLIDRSWVVSRVAAQGTSGLASMVFPPSRQKSLRQLYPAEFASKKPAVATPPRKSGTSPRSR